MINAPRSIQVPKLYAGNYNIISWDPVEIADGYILYRALNGSGSLERIGDAATSSYTDFIPASVDGASVKSAAYGVSAYMEWDYTWDELDEMDRTWDEWDALDWSWAQESEITESGWNDVSPNASPSLTVEWPGSVIFKGFRFSYSATDPNPNTVLTYTIYLDHSLRETVLNAVPLETYSHSISDVEIYAMEDGTRHQLQVIVEDQGGLKSIRSHEFTVVEDLATDAQYILYRDNIPIYRGQHTEGFTDYSASAGNHTYFVRAIDKYGSYNDSNSVTASVNLDYTVLSLAQDPSWYIEFEARRDDWPQNSYNLTKGYTEAYLQGRSRKVIITNGEDDESHSLVYTLRNFAEFERLKELISSGKTLLLRRPDGLKMFGKILQLPAEFFRLLSSDSYSYPVDISLTIQAVDYDEAAFD